MRARAAFPAWPRRHVAEDLHRCFGVVVTFKLNQRARRARAVVRIGREVYPKIAEYLGVVWSGPESLEAIERHLYELLTLLPQPGCRARWLSLRTRWLGKDVVYFPPDELPPALARNRDLRRQLAGKPAVRARVLAAIPAFREGATDTLHIALATPHIAHFQSPVRDIDREDDVLQAAAIRHRRLFVHGAIGKRGGA